MTTPDLKALIDAVPDVDAVIKDLAEWLEIAIDEGILVDREGDIAASTARARILLAARSSSAPSATAVPDGWKLVPEEPTVEMLMECLPQVGGPTTKDDERLVRQAIFKLASRQPEHLQISAALGLIHDWRNMLTAAPSLDGSK